MTRQRSDKARPSTRSKSARGARKRSTVTPNDTRFTFDPFFACLLFAGVGLGTLTLATSARLVILWVTLLVLWLAYREGQPIRLQYRFPDVGRGVLIGMAIGVPVTIAVFGELAMAVPILYVGSQDLSGAGVVGALLFTLLVLLAPVAEEMFFRDILQRERGLVVSIVVYAVAGVILFLPTAGDFFVVLVAVSGAMALLGVLYAFLFERYGLTVTLACHITLNLCLLYVPVLASCLDLM